MPSGSRIHTQLLSRATSGDRGMHMMSAGRKRVDDPADVARGDPELCRECGQLPLGMALDSQTPMSLDRPSSSRARPVAPGHPCAARSPPPPAVTLPQPACRCLTAYRHPFQRELSTTWMMVFGATATGPRFPAPVSKSERCGTNDSSVFNAVASSMIAPPAGPGFLLLPCRRPLAGTRPAALAPTLLCLHARGD